MAFRRRETTFKRLSLLLSPDRSTLFAPNTLKILFTLILIGTVSLAFASNEEATPIIDQPAEDGDTVLDTVHEKFGVSINNVSQGIDNFFGSTRTDIESTGSRVHIYMVSETDTNADPKFEPQLNLMIRLPRTEDRFRLFVQSGFRQQGDENLTPLQQTIFARQAENWFATAVQYVIYSSEQWNIHNRTGIAWRDITPDPFTSLYARYMFPFDTAIARLSQEVLWYVVNGPEEESRLEIDRNFSERFFLRLTTSGNWRLKSDVFALSQFATLLHKPKSRYALAYSVGVVGHSDNGLHLEKYTAEVRFRTDIWRKWFFIEIKPVADFPSATNFQFTPKIFAIFEAVFGTQ